MKFDHCFAERALQDTPGFESLSARFRDFEWIDNYQEFRRETVHREKRCLILAKKRGKWIKPFHCYDHNSEFRYVSLDVAEGCLFDCVYCYLQTYLNHGALVLFTDVESVEPELRESGERLWISTGLLTDSLLAESVFPTAGRISRMVPAGSLLELRTKAASIECVRDPDISREAVVLSWSVNPEGIAQKFEYGAATLSQRLEAARGAIDLGYRIAFHLDPVFHFDGWSDAYHGLLRQLLEFPADRVAFVSLGLFRFMPDLGAIIRRRFPYHPILTGEFFPETDGKYHYLRAIRREMHRAFQEWLRPWAGQIPVFWSMEPDASLVRTPWMKPPASSGVV